MKNNQMNPLHIDYPFESNLLYKGNKPFIRITSSHFAYYGYTNKTLQFVNLRAKPIHCISVFQNYSKPTEQHENMLSQATKKIKGISYQILYVCDNQFLCLGIVDHSYISVIILTINLNNKGYYEIQGIQDIFNKNM